MTEKEKMLAGLLYNPSDSELSSIRIRAHNLCRKYNSLPETSEKRKKILKEALPNAHNDIYLQGPVQFDYGVFTTIGKGTYVNFNFTCLDCAPVEIGENVFFGPNVNILTPIHPMVAEERIGFSDKNGNVSILEYAKPVKIEDNCWIAGNVTICGGLTIGKGSVIGAGSVVTKDIPEGSFAAGVPCRVIRKISEKDSLEEESEKYFEGK